MKRMVCSSHISYVRNNKSANLTLQNCSVCKRKSNIGPLQTAHLFKILADDLEFSVAHPEYDPHGISIQNSAEKAIKAYFKLIHPAYGKPFLESLQKEFINE